MRVLSLICVVFFAFTGTAEMQKGALASDPSCSRKCQVKLITEYYQNIDKIMMTGSSMQDVEHFLSLLHDDVRYIHVEYEADFTKDVWRKAFKRQMDKGSYDSPQSAVTTVANIIHGHRVAAVEFIDRYKDDTTGELKVTPPRLAIFTFQEGKIVKIEDMWYHLSE